MYRPTVAVAHTPEPGVDPAAARFTSESPPWIGTVARALQRSERRIEIVAAPTLFPDTSQPLTLEAVSSRLQELESTPGTPDLTIGVGPVRQRTLSDVDYYQPLVGYTKTRYHAQAHTTIIDPHDTGAAESLRFETDYSDMVAQMVYGVMTIGRPQAAIRQAIVDDVTRRVREVHPSGPVRVLVLFQPEPSDPSPPPGAGPIRANRRVGACGCRNPQATAASDSR